MSPKTVPLWRCDVCGETGTGPTLKVRRAALAHHYLKCHNDLDW